MNMNYVHWMHFDIMYKVVAQDVARSINGQMIEDILSDAQKASFSSISRNITV